MILSPIKWKNNKIVFIDQTELPSKLKYVTCSDINSLCKAIKELKLRGAPLIGVSSALGYALCAVKSKAKSLTALKKELKICALRLKATRPTAVNLFWAIKRMEDTFSSHCERSETISKDRCVPALKARFLAMTKKFILKEALAILHEDQAMCCAIGKNASRLIKNGDVILTHCNAGILATAGYGTALSPFYEAKKQGKKFKVYSDETRPLMQGSRLTCWELMKNGIDVTLICDDMAAHTIKNKNVTKIMVGADRIAANGDSANKIGTYNLAILAKYHKIPFYILAPNSTIDRNIKRGKDIPIEERKREELIYVGKKQTAPLNIKVFNPAFDVTPSELITAIITEKGIYDIKKFRRVYSNK